jgi:hypothetical protein
LEDGGRPPRPRWLAAPARPSRAYVGRKTLAAADTPSARAGMGFAATPGGMFYVFGGGGGGEGCVWADAGMGECLSLKPER